jgi:O-antigen/teichoic acid export membrane protein
MLYYSHNSMKAVYNFGFWNFLRAQFGFMIDHIDRVLIGRFLGPVPLGFYDKSMSIAVVPSNSVIMNINSVMFSSFSRTKESEAELRHQFLKSLTVVSIVSLPIYTGLICIAPYFVEGLLGEKWAPMIVPFQIVLAGFLPRSFAGLIASLNVGIGKYRSHTIRVFISMVVFAVSCALLLRIGLLGVAAGFVIYCVAMCILTMSLSVSSVGISWKDAAARIWPGFRASGVMFLAVMSFSHFLLVTRCVVNLGALSAIGAVVCFVLLLFDKSEVVADLRKTILRDVKHIRMKAYVMF